MEERKNFRNCTLEAIKIGQAVPPKELFELVNVYNVTTLSLFAGKQLIFSILVNKFEAEGNLYEFSQDCTPGDNKYIVCQENILSAKGEWNEDADAILIKSQLKDGVSLQMIILLPSDNYKITGLEGYHETDVYFLQEFLDAGTDAADNWRCTMAKVTDLFGFDLKMLSPSRIYISTVGEGWKLHIGDGLNTFEIPVVDDICNSYYIREGESTKEFVVKPYGQPFMEVSILFFKANCD